MASSRCSYWIIAIVVALVVVIGIVALIAET
jgi:hypothetical protein